MSKKEVQPWQFNIGSRDVPLDSTCLLFGSPFKMSDVFLLLLHFHLRQLLHFSLSLHLSCRPMKVECSSFLNTCRDAQPCGKNITVPVSGTGEKLRNVTIVPSRGEIPVNLTLLEKQHFEFECGCQRGIHIVLVTVSLGQCRSRTWNSDRMRV